MMTMMMVIMEMIKMILSYQRNHVFYFHYRNLPKSHMLHKTLLYYNQVVVEYETHCETSLCREANLRYNYLLNLTSQNVCIRFDSEFLEKHKSSLCSETLQISLAFCEIVFYTGPALLLISLL